MSEHHLHMNIHTTDLQLVDGNNFFYNRFVKSTDLNMIRSILDTIERCTKPPVFVFDGYNNDQRRRDLFPGYKVRNDNRSLERENIYHNVRLIKGLMLLVNCVMIEVPTWEADDVIATLARQTSAKGQKVIVITADKDIAQLGVLPHVTVLSDSSKILANDIRLFKTLRGDPSDKIPGIPGFGPVMFERCNKGHFKQMLNFPEWHPRFDAAALGVTEKHMTWIEQNFGLLRSYWLIVALMDVPDVDIQKGITVGVSNPAAVDDVLREFML